MFGLGWAEVLIIAAIGLVVFYKWLPRTGKMLGKGMVHLKKGATNVQDQIQRTVG